MKDCQCAGEDTGGGSEGKLQLDERLWIVDHIP